MNVDSGIYYSEPPKYRQMYAGKDGYVFEKPEYYNKDIKVSVVYYPSLKDLQEYYASKTGHPKDIKAFTFIHRNECEIHIVDPLVDYEPEFMGHEFYHCIYGNWHPIQE